MKATTTTTTTTVVTAGGGEGGDTGVTASALYDYQAAADDEISFDPNDIITNIEMVSVFFFFLSPNFSGLISKMTF